MASVCLGGPPSALISQMTKFIEERIRRANLARHGQPSRVLGGGDRRRHLIKATMAVIAGEGLAADSTRAAAARARIWSATCWTCLSTAGA